VRSFDAELRELAERLDGEAGGALERIAVEVEESPGLAGRCVLRPPAAG